MSVWIWLVACTFRLGMKGAAWIGLLLASLPLPAFASRSWAIRGTVEDSSGAVVPEAELIVECGPRTWIQRSQLDGTFEFSGLPFGECRLRARAAGFQEWELKLTPAAATKPLRIQLKPALLHQRVEVQTAAVEVPLSWERAGGTKLEASILESLPALDSKVLSVVQDLVGGGGQVFVEGVEVDRLAAVRKEIASIRIEENPYSAAYQEPVEGRIEVELKRPEPGFRGGVELAWRHSALDARNALAPVKAPYRRGLASAWVSGPLWARPWSFSASYERQAEDRDRTIRALLPEGEYRAVAIAPERDRQANLRLYYQNSPRSLTRITLGWEQSSERNQGIGDFTLPSAAFDVSDREVSLHFYHHRLLSPSWTVRWDARLERDTERELSRSSDTRIVVSDAFVTGGAQRDNADREWELRLYWLGSRVSPRGRLHIGFQMPSATRNRVWRADQIAGVYYFASLEDYLRNRPYVYRRTLAPASLAFTQQRVAGFVQHEFSLNSRLLVAAGLRYDRQRVVPDANNFGPRFGLAVGLDRAGRWVLRVGAGLFYRSLPSDVYPASLLNDGVRLREIQILQPAFPDQPFGAGEIVNVPVNVVRLHGELRNPRMSHAGWSLDFKPGKRLSFSWSGWREWGEGLFRAIDLNAPDPVTGSRPFPAFGIIREVQSSARSRSWQWRLRVQGKLSPRVDTVWRYTRGRSWNDTDGPLALPADSRQLASEWGPSPSDRPHQLWMAWVIRPAKNWTLGWILSARSGSPYSLRSGVDENQDGLLLERPAGHARNSQRLPAQARCDVRVAREWVVQVSEREIKLQLVGQAFNVFNRVNVTGVVTNVRSPWLGTPVSVEAARRLQLGFEMEWE